LPSKKNIVNGIAPLTLRITLDRKTTYLTLGKPFSICICDWDYKKDLPKRSNNNDLFIHNLKKLEMIVNNELMKISAKLNDYSLREIREIVSSKLNNIDEEVDIILDNKVAEIDFLSYFHNLVERKKQMEKFGTYINYGKIYSNIYFLFKSDPTPFLYSFSMETFPNSSYIFAFPSRRPFIKLPFSLIFPLG